MLIMSVHVQLKFKPKILVQLWKSKQAATPEPLKAIWVNKWKKISEMLIKDNVFIHPGAFLVNNQENDSSCLDLNKTVKQLQDRRPQVGSDSFRPDLWGLAPDHKATSQAKVCTELSNVESITPPELVRINVGVFSEWEEKNKIWIDQFLYKCTWIYCFLKKTSTNTQLLYRWSQNLIFYWSRQAVKWLYWAHALWLCF